MDKEQLNCLKTRRKSPGCQTLLQLPALKSETVSLPRYATTEADSVRIQ